MTDAELGTKPPPPWGYAATAGWLVLAAAIYTIFAIGVLIFLHPEALSEPMGIAEAMNDGPLVSYTTMVSTAVLVAVLTLAARLRHWGAIEYVGLVWPSRRELAVALAALLVLLVAFATVPALLNKDVVTQLQAETYASADAAGVLPLLWLTFIVVAPLGEEVTFRGFLYRGWVRSRHGVVPGILVISALWAVIHIQYDWFGILQVFSMGLYLGWVRWWSGSTALTFLLHAVANLWATVETMVKVEWLS